MLRYLIVQISVRERTDCELFYLSFISKHVPGSDYEKAQEHPQWTALCNSEFSQARKSESRTMLHRRAWSAR